MAKKTLTVGTLFSGIGAFEHALIQLGIEHKILFACDCGERNDLESDGDYVLLAAVVMMLLAVSAVVLLNKKSFAA